MQGWVYIITNKSMPGLVKVGFTERAPELRAAELAGTGMPTPYCVEYRMRVSRAHAVEQEAHRRLAFCRTGREWFRCTVTAAQRVLESVAITEEESSGSPLVPGHALEPYFHSGTEEREHGESNEFGRDNEDATPLPPGHPSRGLV